MEPLLRVRSLSVTFPTLYGPFEAVSDLDLDLAPGERVALMGESGCGKSVLGHAIIGLMSDVADVRGLIEYRGRDLCRMSEEEVRRIRGASIGLIPQSPGSALDPVLRVGRQIDEMYVLIEGKGQKEAKVLTIKRLNDVGFDDPEETYDTYPHRMSGGMCERALIAMGTALDPDLLVADEPTKGLDPESKMHVIDQLMERATGKTLLLITHDYYVAAACDRVVVMYSGQIIEDGPAHIVLTAPRHPYVIGLWQALPENGLRPMPGTMDRDKTANCRFMNRCPFRDEKCHTPQELREIGDAHLVRCCHA